MNNSLIDKIRGGLIVSCQALENEPLHGSFIMGKMALAAKQGGAAGIRANGIEDIRAIKKEVDLPLIGIIKRVYGDNGVFITPTLREVTELCAEGVDILAMDATIRERPDNRSLEESVLFVKREFPNVMLMADTSNADEARIALQLGFDFIAPTLMGYTPYTSGFDISANDFEKLKEYISTGGRVIAEGNIDSPEKARRCLDLGVLAVVTGGAITRPQLITKKFTDAMKSFFPST